MNIESIVQSALSVLPGRRRTKKPELTREQALSACPVRNPSLRWRENDEGEAVIVLPRRRDWMGKFLAWMFFVPETRPIALDDVGTFVWTNCDGESSVSDLVTLLQNQYKLGKREAELSLTEFLKTLGKRGMIGFVIPREIAEEIGDKEREVLGLEEIGTTEESLREAEERVRAEHDADGEPEDAQDE